MRGYTETSGAVISLIVGVGIAILVLVFVAVLGGQVYQTAEPQLQAINNTEIKATLTGAVTSGFKALGLVGNYMPLIVLASVVAIVLLVIFGVFRPYGAGGYGGVL